MKKLIFKIDKKGGTQLVDAVGYGTECQQATANVERRLGVADESSRASTSSLYAEPERVTAQQSAG